MSFFNGPSRKTADMFTKSQMFRSNDRTENSSDDDMFENSSQQLENSSQLSGSTSSQASDCYPTQKSSQMMSFSQLASSRRDEEDFDDTPTFDNILKKMKVDKNKFSLGNSGLHPSASQDDFSFTQILNDVKRKTNKMPLPPLDTSSFSSTENSSSLFPNNPFMRSSAIKEVQKSSSVTSSQFIDSFNSSDLTKSKFQNVSKSVAKSNNPFLQTTKPRGFTDDDINKKSSCIYDEIDDDSISASQPVSSSQPKKKPNFSKTSQAFKPVFKKPMQVKENIGSSQKSFKAPSKSFVKGDNILTPKSLNIPVKSVINKAQTLDVSQKSKSVLKKNITVPMPKILVVKDETVKENKNKSDSTVPASQVKIKEEKIDSDGAEVAAEHMKAKKDKNLLKIQTAKATISDANVNKSLPVNTIQENVHDISVENTEKNERCNSKGPKSFLTSVNNKAKNSDNANIVSSKSSKGSNFSADFSNKKNDNSTGLKLHSRSSNDDTANEFSDDVSTAVATVGSPNMVRLC